MLFFIPILISSSINLIFQSDNMESLKFANFVFEIDMARDDEKLHEVIIKGKKLNKKLLL